jgi:hypothetical protein
VKGTHLVGIIAVSLTAGSLICHGLGVGTMSKAPRDKATTTPKKRNRKTSSANGNGVHAENGNGDVAAPVTIVTEVVTETQVTSNLEEQIRQRAYEIYLQRGGNGGSPEQDWLRAVEEVRGQQRTA